MRDQDWMELTWLLAHHFPDEFIDALAAKDLGLEVLADYLDDRFEELTNFKNHASFIVIDEERTPKDEEDDTSREDQFEMPKGGVTLDEVRDQDWMELTWRLAHHFPDEFFHVFQILASRNRAAEAPPLKAAGAEDEDAAGEKPAGPAEESAL